MEFTGYNSTKSLRDCGHASWRRAEIGVAAEFSPPPRSGGGAGGGGQPGGQDAAEASRNPGAVPQGLRAVVAVASAARPDRGGRGGSRSGAEGSARVSWTPDRGGAHARLTGARQMASEYGSSGSGRAKKAMQTAALLAGAAGLFMFIVGVKRRYSMDEQFELDAQPRGRKPEGGRDAKERSAIPGNRRRPRAPGERGSFRRSAHCPAA